MGSWMFQSGVQRRLTQIGDINLQVVNIYMIFKALRLDEISKGGVHIVKKTKD